MKKQNIGLNSNKLPNKKQKRKCAAIIPYFKYILATIAIIIAFIAVFFGESKFILEEKTSANVNFNKLYYINVETGEKFITLQDAVNKAATDNPTGKNTIRVLNGREETDAVTVPADKEIELDLNGKTVAFNIDAQSEVTSAITNNGTLTITDATEATEATDEYSYTFKDETKLQIGGTLKSNKAAVTNNGTATIEGTANIHVTGNDTYTIVNDGTFTVENGTIRSTNYRAIVNGESNPTSANITINDGTLIAANQGIRNLGNINQVTGQTVTAQAVKITGGRFETQSNTIVNADASTGLIYITGGDIKGGLSELGIPTIYNGGNGKIIIDEANFGDTVITDYSSNAAIINAYSANATGTTEIRAGTIISKSGNGIRNPENGTIIIGKDETAIGETLSVSTTVPSITGVLYGVSKISGTFKFYDGIIKAPVGHTIDGAINEKPQGYTVVNGTEVIDGTTYETAFLQKIIPDTIINTESMYVAGAQVRVDGVHNWIGNDKEGKNYEATTWADISGSGHDGAITLGNGKWGENYLEFDGTNTWVNLGPIDNEKQSIDVTFAVSSITSGNQCIIGNWEDAGGGISINNQGKIHGEYYIGSSYASVDSVTIVEPGKVYNAQITYDGNNVCLYVNGVKESEVARQGVIRSSSNSTVMSLGSNPSGSTIENGIFKGKIYSAGVYDRARSQEEVLQNATASLALAGGPVSSGNLTYTIRFPDAVTGFTADDITLTNGTKGTFTEVTAGKVYTLDTKASATSTTNTAISQKITVPEGAAIITQSNEPTSEASRTVDILPSYQNTTTNKYYFTLKDAFDDAQTNQTIKVIRSNIDGSSSDPTIAAEKTVTFDTDGKTVILKGITLINRGTLTMQGDGKITGSTADTISNDGTFTKNGNSTISNTGSYAVINNSGTKNVVITEGNITGTGNNAIYSTSTGTITIGTAGNSSVTSPAITGCIGVASASCGLLTVNSGKITATGGEAINSYGSITINGGAISATSSYAVYQNANAANTSAKLTINGGTITSTSSYTVTTRNTYGATVEINGGTITRTATTGAVGAVNNQLGTTIVTGGTIENKSGQGIFADSGTINNQTVYGSVTVGTNEATPSVSTSVPSITGTTYGVQVNSAGTFNFYDGRITGETGKSVSKEPDNTPTGYRRKVTDNGNGTETSTLDNHYNVRYLSGNLPYGLDDCTETYGLASGGGAAQRMKYSINNGTVSVTALTDDGFGYTTGRVYLETGKTYRFTCDTNGTWGSTSDTVEAYLALNGNHSSNSQYIRMSSNDCTFTVGTTGTYHLRLDVNTSGKSYTFSNISVNEMIDTRSIAYGATYATLPAVSRTGYTSQGWAMENLFDRNATPAIASTYIIGDGTTTSYNEYSVYQVNIEPNTTYRIINSGGLTAPGYALFDSSGNYLAGENYTNRNVITFTTPQNAVYIKFSVVTSGIYYKDTFYLGKVVNNDTIMDVTENHDIYALWTPNKLTINYYADGAQSSSGDIIVDQLLRSTDAYYDATNYSSAGLPDYDRIGTWSLMKIGYSATKYWNVGSATSTTRVHENTAYATVQDMAQAMGILSNLESGNTTVNLYAGWQIDTYNLTYDLAGGSVETANPTSYNVETADITLNDPTKTGYSFAGWTEQLPSLTWTAGSINQDNGSIWNDPSYPNGYYSNAVYLESGKKYTLSGYDTYSGFKWSGYGTDGSYLGNLSSSNTCTPTQNCYVRIQYYNASTAAQRNGTIITSGTKDITEVIQQGSTGNRKFTANWTANTYTLNVDPNGGTIPTTSGWTLSTNENNKQSASKTVTYGGTYGTLPTPTRNGYTFEGWYNVRTADDISFTASSSNNNTYRTVDYNIQPGVTYTITLNATKNSGSATKFSTRIYDHTASGTLAVVDTAFGNSKTVTITCPATANKTHKLSMLLYAGTAGSTAGNSVSFTNIKIATTGTTTSTNYTSSSTVTTDRNHTLYAIWQGVQVGDRINYTPNSTSITSSPKSLKTLNLKTINNTEINLNNNQINLEQVDNQSEDETETPNGNTTNIVELSGVQYSTISEAIASANSGDTIKLLQDQTLEDTIEIPNDKNITLDLNGKTLTSNSISTITNNGTLTITSKSIGLLKNESSNGVVIINNGELTVDNAIITTSENGGKAIENDGETVTVKSGKIVTEGIGSIGIYNENEGNVVIEKGIIEVRKSGSKAIYNDANLKIEKAQIIVSDDDSTGIYNSKNSKSCEIDGTEITVEADEIENYELIKNTNEFKAELEQIKPSYGIYNESKKEVQIKTATIKVERLKGVGIINNSEGTITLGVDESKEGKEIDLNTASPIIYAIADNTTALINSKKGKINFYDGRILSTSTIKNVITGVLNNYEINEEFNSNNISAILKLIEAGEEDVEIKEDLSEEKNVDESSNDKIEDNSEEVNNKEKGSDN